MSRDNAIVLDILKSVKLANEFVGNLNKEAFFQDLKTQSAVLHQLLLTGEAVKRLSGSFRNAHPEVPWKNVAGMRDVLIHQYYVPSPSGRGLRVRAGCIASGDA